MRGRSKAGSRFRLSISIATKRFLACNLTYLTMTTEIDDGFLGGKNGILTKAFLSCASDPQGSVHRAWGISLLFVVIYFIAAIIESE